MTLAKVTKTKLLLQTPSSLIFSVYKLKTFIIFQGGGVKFYFHQFCSEAETEVSADLDNKPLMVSRLAHEQSTDLYSSASEQNRRK